MSAPTPTSAVSPPPTSAGPSPLSPLRLGGLTLRNRTIKSATFEGMTRGAVPTADLVAFHQRVAAGGVGIEAAQRTEAERIAGDGLVGVAPVREADCR